MDAIETMEHIRTWKAEHPLIGGDPFRLELYFSHISTTSHGNRAKLGYQFHHGGRLIFEGDDFSPSPMYNWDGDETIAALLSFLSLRPGDTDDEYFDDYTEDQMEWAEMHGEELSWIAMEMEEKIEGKEV